MTEIDFPQQAVHDDSQLAIDDLQKMHYNFPAERNVAWWAANGDGVPEVSGPVHTGRELGAAHE